MLTLNGRNYLLISEVANRWQVSRADALSRLITGGRAIEKHNGLDYVDEAVVPADYVDCIAEGKHHKNVITKRPFITHVARTPEELDEVRKARNAKALARYHDKHPNAQYVGRRGRPAMNLTPEQWREREREYYRKSKAKKAARSQDYAPSLFE